jgi:trigger factor
VKSSVEPLEGNKVKVVVDVEEAELGPALDVVWREIAKEVRLPGFRPGKAPRKLLEQQVDPGYVRSEALRNALPEHYTRAVIEHDVDVIAPPQLDITGGEDSGDVTFEAVVEVRPVVTVAGYAGLRVDLPNPEVTDDEVDEQIDRLRSQYGELVTVQRPAVEGDVLVVDIEGTRDGEAVEGLAVEAFSYVLGSGMVAPEFDEHLGGATADAVVEFDADHPDPDEDAVHFRLSVQQVQERELPELTDECVADATEFDSVEQFRDDTRRRLATSRESMTRQAVRAGVGSELAKLVDLEVPDAMVDGEFRMRLQNMTQQLGASGIGLEDYLRATGRDPQEFAAELREACVEGVKVDLALRAVAEAEALHATDEELDEEVAGMIGGGAISIEEAIEQLRDAGQFSAVRSGIANRKALEWLVAHTEFVDPDGNPIPESFLEPLDHDHDHDHTDEDDDGDGGAGEADQD